MGRSPRECPLVRCASKTNGRLAAGRHGDKLRVANQIVSRVDGVVSCQQAMAAAQMRHSIHWSSRHGEKG